jgi:LacI family transcriptional regulator
MSISQAKIAQQVGVSRSAVSHVLNGRTHMVGADVRDRILEAVEVSGYHRNALVNALKTNRTHVIGIIVPEAALSFFGEVVRAAEREARLHGLQCFLCQSYSQPEDLEKDVATLREYRVDGLVIAPASAHAKPEVYRALQQQDFPFVLIDTPVTGAEAAFVGNNNLAIGQLATQHLLELGHRRIVCIRGYHDNPGALQRYEGYCKALREAGIPLDPTLVVGDGFEFETGRDALRTLLDDKVSFTGVVTPADYVALGAIQELTERGFSVPKDVSVVGCANLDVSRMVAPPLTTVDQEPEAIGRIAVQLLVKHIEGKTKTLEEINIKPRLIVRGTTANASAPSS